MHCVARLTGISARAPTCQYSAAVDDNCERDKRTTIVRRGVSTRDVRTAFVGEVKTILGLPDTLVSVAISKA